jgi:hypothetical protein
MRKAIIGIAALALIGAGAAGASAIAHSNHSMNMNMNMDMHMPAATPLLRTAKSVTFRQNMRKLWEDHITWTRLAIISLEGNTPDTSATVARLLQNQSDIGNAVRPFYGKAVGAKLTRLLREHILIAADLIAAAKAGDSAKVAATQTRWIANADDISRALHGVNPRYFPLAAMKDEMHMHLQLTTQEAVDHLQGNWTADVADYDKVHTHILHMADMLSTGIIRQFPKRFR